MEQGGTRWIELPGLMDVFGAARDLLVLSLGGHPPMPLLRPTPALSLSTVLALTGVLAACSTDTNHEESITAESTLGSDACAR